MQKRYEGFLAPHGLYILDTDTGEVRFVQHNSIDIQSQGIEIKSSINSATSKEFIGTVNNQLSPFENEVVSSYPYLIAKPFADLLKEKDARMKCKLMVDTFTAVLKFMALQLASEYIRANDVKDIQVHQTLTKDLSRPLISAWNLLISRCLPVLKDNKISLFSPEIKDAYEKLETKCKEPFLVSQTYSDENGEIKTRIKKLGKIQALINYRNGLAHGFNQSQSRAQKEFDEYYPLLCDILQEVRYVSRYTLWHVESSREGVDGIRLMGASPSMKKVDFKREGVNPAISPLFLINDASGEILPLYAFFDVDNSNESGLPEIGKDVFVFEGNTKNTVIYLSSSGEHLEKSSRFQHWKDLLSQKQLEVEWADAKDLSLEVLHAIGKHISATGIQALITSGKYLREATIPRQDFNELLDSFSYGIYTGFVLGGESGIGKSTLLAQKTEEWQAEGHVVIFYRGSALNQSDVANKFLRDFALKVNYIEDFLSLLNPLFHQNSKKCYLIIDALNEFADDLNDLIRSVENIVAQASNYPWFKLIVSIRDSAYNRVKSRFGELAELQYFTVDEDKGGEKVRTNIVRLKPVAKDFIEQLYNAYREYKCKDNSDTDNEAYYKFRPLTTFGELNPDESTVQLMRSPLMARIVMQSFHRAKLPQKLNNDDAMRLYQDNIVLEKSDDSLGFPERKKLLNLLVSEYDRISVERLERDDLLKHPVIRPYLVNAQKDSAYIQLLDLGVLMEEWEGENCYVRFSFDKFLEFLLAELHWPKIHDSQALMCLCNRAVSFKILQGAIEIIIVRFCLNNQINLLVEFIDLANNEHQSTQMLAKEIGLRVLFTLCMEYHSIFELVLSEFPKDPSNIDLLILKDLIQKLFITGHLNGYDRNILSDLLLSSVQFDMFEGRYDDARLKLNEIIKEKLDLKDSYGHLLAMKQLGNLEWRQGNMNKSLDIYEMALHRSKQLKYIDINAALLNNIGLLKKHFGKIEEAEKLFLDSLEIKQQLGEKRGISMSLNNLGILYKEQGKIEEAKKLYLESLEIKRHLGDKRGVSSSLKNLGILCFENGKFDEAKKYYNESLKIKHELKDIMGIIGTIHSFFPLMNEKERVYNYNEARMLINRLSGPNHLSQWANIDLMFYCLSGDSIDISLLNEKITYVLQQKDKSTLKDIDDLPIEAFYCTVVKLVELNQFEIAKELSATSLSIISEFRSIRKKYFQSILKT
jgi:tetratricopeptide (TPR) repeat protein